MSRHKKPLKALPDSNRHDLERKLSHIFSDPNLLWEALQAAGNGVIQIGDRKIEDGNKKMAMLGDTILQLAVLNEWFESGDSRSEFLTPTSQTFGC
jgi:ribonuclease III